MKKIEALVKPFKLDDVKENLRGIGVQGMTVSQVMGSGSQSRHAEIHRGIAYDVDFLPQIKIEIVAAETQADDIVAAIVKGARTGKTGDGKVFVYDVDEAVCIRNAERGANAL